MSRPGRWGSLPLQASQTRRRRTCSAGTCHASAPPPEAVSRKEDVMPGKQVKDWDKYHALREQGMSKEQAAKIANSDKKKGAKK